MNTAIRNPQSVLIIDDDEDDALIMKRVLSKIAPGVAAEVATSGELGLTRLQREVDLPALILLDLKMRGIDGIEVLQRIRGDDRLRHIPVIVITHSTLESDEKSVFDAGGDGFVHKALDIDQFGREMKSVLDNWLRG